MANESKHLCLGCMEEIGEGVDVCPHCGYDQNTPAKEPYHIAPGSILHNRYVVGKVLGYGGFGITYIGYDAVLKRKVAIKEYLPGDFCTRAPGQQTVSIYTDEKELQYNKGLESFVNEAKRLAKFSGVKGIVSIIDTFEINNTAYIVMEYLSGKNLKDIQNEKGNFTFEEARDILTNVLYALEEVHKEGIIHRDINPKNIIVTDEGEVKLIDFGAARYASTSHSKSLSVIFTPGYAPEEQYRSRGEQGPWTDVYGCAATMYKMITGITPEEALERMNMDTLREPSKCGVKISPSNENALMNALNISAEDRTQSAQAFLDDLYAEDVARNKIKQKKKDSGKMPWYLKVACALVPVLVAMAFIFVPQMVQAELFNNMPSLTGKTVEQGEKNTSALALTFKVNGTVENNTLAEGTIVLQDPAAGQLVMIGDLVNVTVSSGCRQVLMPDLTCYDLSMAESLLKQLDIKYEIEELESEDYLNGVVISQSAEANKFVSAGTINAAVKLTVCVNPKDELGDKVNVPNVAGKPLEEARKTMLDSGLFVRVVASEYSESVPEGCVISQNPAGGKTEKGRCVNLTVSMGEEKFYMPNVLYQTESAAVAAVEKAGFKVEVKYEKSAIITKGLVSAQSEETNAELKKGTKVILTVSLGNEVKLPSVVGLRESEAKSLLQNAGFGVVTHESYSRDIAKGYVISQTPSGATASEGSTVVIYVSKGISEAEMPISIPYVVGMSENDAAQKLVSARFNISKSYEYSDSTSKGCVISQSDSGSAYAGATISIVISKGRAVTVPNYVGEFWDRYGSVYGLNINLGYQNTAGGDRGKIISQSIAPGTIVEEGTAITLIKSLGKLIRVPNLVGTTTTFVDGLQSNIYYENHNSIPKGVVISQTRPSGSSANEGDYIGIVVSAGPYDWSNWMPVSAADSSVINNSSAYNVQYSDGYRYRSKLLKNSSSETLEGWNYLKTESGIQSSARYPGEAGSGGTVIEEDRIIKKTERNVYKYYVWGVTADECKKWGYTDVRDGDYTAQYTRIKDSYWDSKGVYEYWYFFADENYGSSTGVISTYAWSENYGRQYITNTEFYQAEDFNWHIVDNEVTRYIHWRWGDWKYSINKPSYYDEIEICPNYYVRYQHK